MYERMVDVPRLYAVLGEDGPVPAVLQAMQGALSTRYSERFTRISLGYYRDGRDSVAFHGDRIAQNAAQRAGRDGLRPAQRAASCCAPLGLANRCPFH